MSADLLTQGLQMGKSFGSSTEFSTSEAPTETVSLATELRDKEDKICEVHWGQGSGVVRGHCLICCIKAEGIFNQLFRLRFVYTFIKNSILSIMNCFGVSKNEYYCTFIAKKRTSVFAQCCYWQW